MNIIEIITKKKNKQPLTEEEIKFAVMGYVNGTVKDYQMSALLMAITINGMVEEETIFLTKVMIESGHTIDLSKIGGTTVDKHSTGGVGDKTTLVLIPLVASCGVNVAKMSGRGLGITGGTIDKLESIENYQVNLSEQQFIEQMKKIGCAVISQTSEVAIADKYLYALRDVTGTTESIPLIAASIMSKKIACGSSAIVIDVKVGNGALMKDIESARSLANLMIKIGSYYNKKVVCVLTNMEEPLGYAIGNGLEVKESIETLKNNAPSDLLELVLTIATIMVSIGKNISKEEALKEVKQNLENGKAYQKWNDMVLMQHGNLEHIKINPEFISIKSEKTGYIKTINTYKLGEICKEIGAGRVKKEDKIDYGVGIVLNKKVGDFIKEGEEILKIYTNKEIASHLINNIFEIVENEVPTPKLILDILE